MTDFLKGVTVGADPDNDGDEDQDETERLSDLHTDSVAEYKKYEEAWAKNRKAWLEDAKFKALDQWPEKIKTARDKAGRPTLVVDKVNQYVRQVVNDGRQNRPEVKVSPTGNGAHPKAAEAFEGVIRGICNDSVAGEAFDTSLDHAVTGGFGWFRVITDYEHENTFNQKLLIRRIRNAMAVLIDPSFHMADGSDIKGAFVVDQVQKAEFERNWPKAKFVDWKSDGKKYSDGWISDDSVRVAERFYIIESLKPVHQLADGTVVPDDEYQVAVKELGEQNVPAITDTRQITQATVKWCRLSGAEVLEEKEWLGKYIPILGVFGNEIDLDGEVIYSGLIRAAKDAMRLYNFSRSAFAERVALTPKAPFVAAMGQVENHPEWEDANTENYSVLVYDAIDVNGNPVPPPQRQNPSDVPAGFAQDMQMSEHDIQASMGMYAANLGQQGNEKSGKAILARQHQGDIATFHFQDNQSRAICHLGRILVDLIPKIYDSKRVLRMLGQDGKASMIQHDPSQEQGVSEQGSTSIYNLGVGTFDVSVSSGPNYNTKRQEAADAQLQLAQSVPQMWQMAGDIMIRNMDWPGADAIADRWKLMLPPPILQAEAGQQQLPPEIQQAQKQIQDGQQQLTQAHQELTQQAQQVAQDQAANEASKAKLDAARKELNAEKQLLQSKYEELSAKLELQAMKSAQVVPAAMPQGPQDPAIMPDGAQPPPTLQQPPQAPQGAFFTP